MATGKQVSANIINIYNRRKIAVYAISLKYAALALNYFRQHQRQGEYWQNQTGVARDTVFTDAYVEDNIVGWFIAHMVEYGPYLELSNDGKHQAIRPVMEMFAPMFIRDVKELYT